MGSTVLELVVKAVLGGCTVVAFALLSQTLSPKRFAGIFAAAPAVAIASLSATAGFDGTKPAQRACVGMIAGACGFIGYCLVTPASVGRFGALRGCALSLVAWAATTSVVLPLVATAPVASAAKGAVLLRRSHPSERPNLVLGRLRETTGIQLSTRFGLGAGTSLLAGVVSVALGPLVGGSFLAFPAVLLASLTLIADEEGRAAARDDARGATLGAVGLLAFAVTGTVAYGSTAPLLVLVYASIAWSTVAFAGYATVRLTGHGDDEAEPALRRSRPRIS